MSRSAALGNVATESLSIVPRETRTMVHETQKVSQLTEAEVISSIEDFLYRDGPYLEVEHRQLAREHGLNEERIAQLWQKAADQARQDLADMRAKFASVSARFDALRPKIDEAKRKL